MRLLALTLGFAAGIILTLAPQARAATLVLDPIAECQWIYLGRRDDPNPKCPSLDTRQDSRAALTFDLAGIDPSLVVAATLELVPVQYYDSVDLRIEAISIASSFPLDPFVYTNIEPEVGPCDPLGASCAVLTLTNPDHPAGTYGFSRPIDSFPRVPADVTEAFGFLDGDAGFLQLSLFPAAGGIQFGHSGFVDLRLAPATLTLEVVPEPSTALILGLGLAGLAGRENATKKCQLKLAFLRG